MVSKPSHEDSSKHIEYRSGEVRNSLINLESFVNDCFSSRTDDILDDFLMPQAPEMFNDIEQLPEVKLEEPEESFMEQIMPEPMDNIKMENIQPVNDPLEMTNNNWMDQNLQQTPPPQQHQHFDKCLVCARVFKNPNSLEKHLRNTHTGKC